MRNFKCAASFYLFLAFFFFIFSEQLMIHLAQFGYTQSSAEEIKIGKRISKKAMSIALKEYQDFNNLEVTGNLDLQTMIKMQQRRCGNPDKFPEHSRNKRFVHCAWSWSKKIITYSINNYHKSYYHLPRYISDSEINRAAETWTEFIPLKLELDSSSNADISISFETRKHGCNTVFDGPYGILAHSFCPLHPLSTMKSIIHFDDEEYWHFDDRRYSLKNTMDGPNFFQIAVHEFGHALGLEHSKDPNAVMQAHYPGKFDENFKLALDDVYAIQTLYPKERKIVGPNGELLHTTVPSRTQKTTTLK